MWSTCSFFYVKKSSKNIIKYYHYLQGAAQELRTTRLHGSVKRTGV